MLPFFAVFPFVTWGCSQTDLLPLPRITTKMPQMCKNFDIFMVEKCCVSCQNLTINRNTEVNMRHPAVLSVRNEIISALKSLKFTSTDGQPESRRKRDLNRIKRGADLERFGLESVIRLAVSEGLLFQIKVSMRNGFNARTVASRRVMPQDHLDTEALDAYIRALRCRICMEIVMAAKEQGMSLRTVEAKAFLPQGTLSRKRVAKVDTTLPALQIFYPSVTLTINHLNARYPFSITK